MVDIIGYSGKSPNPLIPPAKPKGGWLPCRAYMRHGARYKPSGNIYGEQMYGVCKEWSDKTIPIGFYNSTAYIGGNINQPFSDTGVHPWMDVNTSTRLITECLLKVQSRKANYGEAIGESLQTVNHLASTVSRLCKIFLGLRRRDPKLIAQGLGLGVKRKRGDFFSSHWLEYQYAWLPLMGDVYDTINLLKDGFGKRPQLIRAVRQLESTSQVDVTVAGIRAKGNVGVRDRCILYYKLRDADLAKWGQVGLINPLEVAWAITPYSFVIDWFLPVGNFLQALSATVGTTFVDGCLSRSTVGSRTLEAVAPTSRYPFKKDKSTYQCVSTHKCFERRVVLSAPLPGIYFKNPFSTNHVASALALLTQLKR